VSPGEVDRSPDEVQAEDELGTSLNDRQEIVEVMGHAARQPPDGL